MTTTPTPTTTLPTVAHDSATCHLGPDGGKCEMCAWVNVERVEEIRELAFAVSQSAAAIRTRRRTLLECADARSPTEGAMALAEAWLDGEEWYQKLPNNAMQDAAVLELVGEIESAVGSWLQGRKEDDQR
jgi:hypothetical protein